MANEIVFVGAGPIGLWTAIQIKLQQPDTEIIFKEKKETYSRTHTLLLKPTAFAGCLKDRTGVIQGIIDQLKENPHIRTNDLEQRLKDLAGQLGIRIDLRAVDNIAHDVLEDHPEAAMVIGSDGVRSKVHTQIFDDEVNTQRVALAYAAQIKYSVQGEAIRESQILQTYPLLKQSNYLASVNVGKLRDGKTPVTIQLVIDKDTYDKISHATYARPIRVLADSIEDQVPPELLRDIKTHIGFRLSNDEDIIIQDINLTASELPQQRRRAVTVLKDGKYYGLTGDAALALSYFKGMNTGLKLATHFSKAIVGNWDKIISQDPTAFDDYEKLYDKFATEAFEHGHEKNHSVRKLFSAIQSGAALPFQFLYFDNNTIANFHRCFDLYNQACSFYVNGQIPEGDGATDGANPGVVPSARSIKAWLEAQMGPGIELLRTKVISQAEAQIHNPRLHKALKALTNLDTAKLDFYDQANLGLAFSKVSTLLEAPTPQNYQACVKFSERLKAAGSSFALLMSSIVELILGLAAIAFGIVATVATCGAAAPYSVPIMAAGALLAGHGIYKLQKNIQGDSAVCKALRAVVRERGNLEDGPELRDTIVIADVELDDDMPAFEIVEDEVDPDVALFTR